eukprot:jgi/Chlat1/2099/Chrsp17S02701
MRGGGGGGGGDGVRFCTLPGVGLIQNAAGAAGSAAASFSASAAAASGSRPFSSLLSQLLGCGSGERAVFELVHRQSQQARTVHSVPLPFASITRAVFGEEGFFGQRRRRIAPPANGDEEQQQGPLVFTKAATKLADAPRIPEHYQVVRVRGDGRCMFRAMVLGLAANKGQVVNSYDEEKDADELRIAVVDALCRNDKRRKDFEEAIMAVTVEEPLIKYCNRLIKPSFWGGEAELLVLSRMLKMPIIVYLPAGKRGVQTRASLKSGYLPIQVYGREYLEPKEGKKEKKPVRLLYNGENHYDLLLS